MKNPGIYILTSPSGNQYVGKDSNLPRRVRDHLSGKNLECPAVHNAIQKYGRDAFSVEIIQYPGISQEALNAVERWWIRRLQTLDPGGYNLTEGGEGLFNPSPEIRQKMSVSSRRAQKKRVDEGTHNFLGSKLNKKRVDEGTNPFLGGEIQRRTNKKRLEEGTHNFLDSEFARRANKKRLEEGAHNFLGESNPVHKKIEDGTHHFLGENNPAKRLAKDGRHPRTLKRLKGEWCYIIAVSRFYYEIHDYTLKRRAEFLSKDIPDTSNAEQEYLF